MLGGKGIIVILVVKVLDEVLFEVVLAVCMLDYTQGGLSVKPIVDELEVWSDALPFFLLVVISTRLFVEAWL